MATFTTLAKIFSWKIFCNTKVLIADLGKIFIHSLIIGEGGGGQWPSGLPGSYSTSKIMNTIIMVSYITKCKSMSVIGHDCIQDD